jgi:hypothetical protein
MKRKSPMSHSNIKVVRCEALFASALQRSEDPTASSVRETIRQTVRNLGSRGCAARVAQEFGDHPETAVLRMRWVRQLVERSFVAPAPAQHRTCRALDAPAGG